MSLIPQKAPDYPGYEFAFYMKTSTEVGGDYYDFFPQDDGSLYVVVGDATGHGLNAGMMVSITKAGLYASDFNEPNITTARLNQTIKSIDLGTTRMSLNMTKINGSSLNFTSAGMPPGYIYNNEKNESKELLIPGLPLGSMKNLKFKSSNFKMNKGDAFVLISDGLPECVNPNGNMLDYEAVEKCVKKNGDKSAQGIIDFSCGSWRNMDGWPDE
jgi:serine phosphatase RsbU (regulator of sigma subunit)